MLSFSNLDGTIDFGDFGQFAPDEHAKASPDGKSAVLSKKRPYISTFVDNEMAVLLLLFIVGSYVVMIA